ARTATPPPVLLGVAAHDTADAVVLKMLAQLLEPVGLGLEVVTDAPTPQALAERVEARAPAVVVLSHLPQVGWAGACSLVRRLRARFPDLPIVVGRWGANGNAALESERLAGVGASHVSRSLADARDHLAARFARDRRPPTAVGTEPVAAAADGP